MRVGPTEGMQGRLADDGTQVQVMTAHAPAPMNHTSDEFDVFWNTLAGMARGKRRIRILAIGANADMSAAAYA